MACANDGVLLTPLVNFSFWIGVSAVEECCLLARGDGVEGGISRPENKPLVLPILGAAEADLRVAKGRELAPMMLFLTVDASVVVEIGLGVDGGWDDFENRLAAPD